MERNVVVNNMMWRFFERVGAQFVTFFVSVVLARILDPEEYGAIAIMTVFIVFLQIFVDGGLGTALIQKKDPDDLDYSSIFYFNLFMGVVLYLVMYVLAPFIASFYNNQAMCGMIRVICLIIIIYGIKNVQQAYVTKNMMFKRFFFSTLGGTIAAGIVGIWMAYSGFGVWALIAQMLVNNTVDTLILWLTVPWKPSRRFSLQRLFSFLKFGVGMIVSLLIATIGTQIRQLMIGKVYTKEDLAFYNQGERLPGFIITNVNTALDSVLFPTLSSVQDNKDRIKQITRRSITTSTYIIFPFLVGLSVCADSFIETVFTAKWLFCVPYLRLFCISYAFYPISTANLNSLKSLKQIKKGIYIESSKTCINLIFLFATIHQGVYAVTAGFAVASSICALANMIPVSWLISYPVWEQLKDISLPLLMSFFMGGVVYGVGLLSIPTPLKLIIQVISGIAVYIIFSRLLHCEPYEYVMDIVYSYIRK